MALAMVGALTYGQIRPDGPDPPQPDETDDGHQPEPSRWDDDFTRDHDGEIVHWEDEHGEDEEIEIYEDEENEWREEETPSPEFLDPVKRVGKCYGIALADSTDFGPYQAGALIGLLKHQHRTGESYAVITGIALGAINAYIMSLFESHEVEEAENELRSFWMDLAQIDPYKLWKGGFIYGFFFEKSLYDSTPLNQFLEHKFTDRTVKQHLNIAVTNVLSGDFKTFSEHHSNSVLIKIL